MQNRILTRKNNILFVLAYDFINDDYMNNRVLAIIDSPSVNIKHKRFGVLTPYITQKHNLDVIERDNPVEDFKYLLEWPPANDSKAHLYDIVMTARNFLQVDGNGRNIVVIFYKIYGADAAAAKVDELSLLKEYNIKFICAYFEEIYPEFVDVIGGVFKGTVLESFELDKYDATFEAITEALSGR